MRTGNATIMPDKDKGQTDLMHILHKETKRKKKTRDNHATCSLSPKVNRATRGKMKNKQLQVYTEIEETKI